MHDSTISYMPPIMFGWKIPVVTPYSKRTCVHKDIPPHATIGETRNGHTLRFGVSETQLTSARQKCLSKHRQA